ncbi:MAG: hypothetical protein ACRC33_22170 [Gemmataceae bacterium]
MSAGLLALVEAAAEAARRAFRDATVSAMLDKVCLECFGGQYQWAESTSRPDGRYTPEEWWDACRLHRLDQHPDWRPFHHAVRLAADLDTFLAVMERHAPVLARACRDDLDLIGVLADWCEDAGLPHAAAETRYHAELVREWRRGPAVPPGRPEFSEWSDAD